MGDSRRFDLMASLVKKQFPNAKCVADIAAGKGYLQIALRERGVDTGLYLPGDVRIRDVAAMCHTLGDTKAEHIIALAPAGTRGE